MDNRQEVHAVISPSVILLHVLPHLLSEILWTICIDYFYETNLAIVSIAVLDQAHWLIPVLAVFVLVTFPWREWERIVDNAVDKWDR